MSLSKLVAEACDNEIELRRLQSSDGQLTPAAYLAAVAAVPGTSAKEAEIIEKALAGHEAELLGPSFRRMSKAINDFKRTGPILKLGGYMDSEGDASLARIGATRQSLFFAAARHATKRSELFGTCTKPGQQDAACKECIANRAELFAAIEQGFVAGDILLERDRATFRMAPSVAVAAGFAERLVNWSIAAYDHEAQAA